MPDSDQRVGALEASFASLRDKVGEMHTQQQLNKLQYQHIDEKLSALEKGQEKLNGHFVKALFALAMMILAAIVNFIIEGGIASV